MDGKDLMFGMGFVDDKFVEEAEYITRIKRASLLFFPLQSWFQT